MSKFDGFDRFDRDEELEANEGVDLRFTDNAVITILRAGGSNKKYARVFGRITKPYQRQMNAGTLDEKLSIELHAKVYAESIIVGWSGIKSGGEEVPFTKQNVIDFLISVPEVFTEIRIAAESMDTFRRAKMESEVEDLGNS